MVRRLPEMGLIYNVKGRLSLSAKASTISEIRVTRLFCIQFYYNVRKGFVLIHLFDLFSNLLIVRAGHMKLCLQVRLETR